MLKHILFCIKSKSSLHLIKYYGIVKANKLESCPMKARGSAKFSIIFLGKSKSEEKTRPKLRYLNCFLSSSLASKSKCLSKFWVFPSRNNQDRRNWAKQNKNCLQYKLLTFFQNVARQLFGESLDYQLFKVVNFIFCLGWFLDDYPSGSRLGFDLIARKVEF